MQPPGTLPRQFTDRLIRDSLLEPGNLRDLMRDQLPAVADSFNYAKRTLLNREVFTDDWHRREGDLLFELPCSDAGPSALLALLIEHHSDTDRAAPVRMFHILSSFWERCWRAWEQLASKPKPELSLPGLIPIVLYTADRPWGSVRNIRDLVQAPQWLLAMQPDWP